ncbi:MAG: DUF488 domain-containing protein [Candidatus Cloacimonetes bacterium]|nr:DUF488 domain-containing protein [Candidatus Cloacimonadota bacterium]
MKIYTSYFAKLRKIPDDIVPISICLKPPFWFKGWQYKVLSPNVDIFTEQKANPNPQLYTVRFYAEVLDLLEKQKVLQDLETFGAGQPVVLLCWEKSTSFCHRHLVAAWLNESMQDKVTEWN